jgi:hypothetical protein
MYLLNKSGQYLVIKYSSMLQYSVGLRFIESLSAGFDKSAINLADKSSPYKVPIY